jgi:hypothetical protein
MIELAKKTPKTNDKKKTQAMISESLGMLV